MTLIIILLSIVTATCLIVLPIFFRYIIKRDDNFFDELNGLARKMVNEHVILRKRTTRNHTRIDKLSKLYWNGKILR